jgi:hypothetical protein
MNQADTEQSDSLAATPVRAMEALEGSERLLTVALAGSLVGTDDPAASTPLHVIEMNVADVELSPHILVPRAFSPRDDDI